MRPTYQVPGEFEKHSNYYHAKTYFARKKPSRDSTVTKSVATTVVSNSWALKMPYTFRRKPE